MTDERLAAIRLSCQDFDLPMDSAHELLAHVDALTEHLDRIAPMSCNECGDHVAVDMDGCCVTCGGQAYQRDAAYPCAGCGNKIDDNSACVTDDDRDLCQDCYANDTTDDHAPTEGGTR